MTNVNKRESIGFILGVVGLILCIGLQFFSKEQVLNSPNFILFYKVLLIGCGIGSMFLGLYSEMKKLAIGWMLIILGIIVMLIGLIQGSII